MDEECVYEEVFGVIRGVLGLDEWELGCNTD